MDRRIVLFVIAAVLVVGGVILGSASIKANGVSCGTTWKSDHYAAQLNESMGAIGYEQDCSDSRSTRKTMTFGALGLGAVALILGVAVPVPVSTRD